MLTVVTYFWGDKYNPDYVRKLASGIRRHLQQEHKFFVVTDVPGEFEDDQEFYRECIPEEDRHLLDVKGCFARLRLFDPAFQDEFSRGDHGGRFVCVDLDAIITGPLDPLFNRPEPFVILQGANVANPCKYNGSLWMLRAGARPDVWTDFSLDAAAKIPFFSFPDDQGWIHHKMPDEAGWQCGPQSGVYAFAKTNWPKDNTLPSDARLVAFPGSRDPSQFTHLPWVKEHWQ